MSTIEKIKRLNPALEKISFFIIFIFSFIGAIITGNIVHELSHQNDFKEFAIKEDICFLKPPKSLSNIILWEAGHYNFTYLDKDEEKILKINKYTEIKAYAFTIIISIVYLIAYAYTYNQWHQKKKS